MGFFKVLSKLILLLLLGAAVAGVVTMARRSSDPVPVSFEEWPDVPQNPAT